jgi:hypothetical protein
MEMVRLDEDPEPEDVEDEEDDEGSYTDSN